MTFGLVLKLARLASCKNDFLCTLVNWNHHQIAGMTKLTRIMRMTGFTGMTKDDSDTWEDWIKWVAWR